MKDRNVAVDAARELAMDSAHIPLIANIIECALFRAETKAMIHHLDVKGWKVQRE